MRASATWGPLFLVGGMSGFALHRVSISYSKVRFEDHLELIVL